MTKLTTDLFAQNECENEEARARVILSSLHDELSIFIDNDWFVSATLSRDFAYNIAADAKDTALKSEIPSNVQDTSDAIFSSKAGVDRLLSMRVKITMHVLVESEKSVSKKFGGIVSETSADVEALVFQQKDLWITLWMECMDDSDNANEKIEQRPPSRSSKGYQGTQHNDVAGYAPTKNNFKHFGQRYIFHPCQIKLCIIWCDCFCVVR